MPQVWNADWPAEAKFTTTVALGQQLVFPALAVGIVALIVSIVGHGHLIGVFRFLLKPVSRDDLVAALTAGVGQHRLVTAERELLERTAALDGRRPVEVEVATAAGNVFVACDSGLTIVATTMPEPSPGLVFYDLKNCLRQVEQPKPRRRRARAKESSDAS